MKGINKCDICGGDIVLVHKRTRDNPKIDVYECTNCFTKQLRSSNVTAGGGGDNDYEHGFMNGKSEMSKEEIQKRIDECKPDDLRRIDMVRPWCENRNVLDFGCGFGGFLKGISNCAKTAEGVELSLTERKYLQSIGLSVQDHIENCEKRFDVITLFHVFEHFWRRGEGCRFF